MLRGVQRVLNMARSAVVLSWGQDASAYNAILFMQVQLAVRSNVTVQLRSHAGERNQPVRHFQHKINNAIYCHLCVSLQASEVAWTFACTAVREAARNSCTKRIKETALKSWRRNLLFHLARCKSLSARTRHGLGSIAAIWTAFDNLAASRRPGTGLSAGFVAPFSLVRTAAVAERGR